MFACCELVFWSLELLGRKFRAFVWPSCIFSSRLVLQGQKKSWEIFLDSCYDVLARLNWKILFFLLWVELEDKCLGKCFFFFNYTLSEPSVPAAEDEWIS